MSDTLLVVAAIIVGVMLFKKLVKWAIIAAIVFFVVLPYLNNSGALESILSHPKPKYSQSTIVSSH